MKIKKKIFHFLLKIEIANFDKKTSIFYDHENSFYFVLQNISEDVRERERAQGYVRGFYYFLKYPGLYLSMSKYISNMTIVFRLVKNIKIYINIFKKKLTLISFYH